MTKLSERLLTVRKQTGLSQADFGKKLGLSDRAYKNYELEIRKLPLEIAKLICREFDINIRWLLLGEGFMNAQTLGDVVEAAVIEVCTFSIKNNSPLSPQQKAKAVRFFVQHMEEYGSISETVKCNFFHALSSS